MKLIGFEDSIVEEVTPKAQLSDSGVLIEVPLNKNKGFNYGYMLFIPSKIDKDTTLIVEGANTGIATTNLEKAKQEVIDNFKSCGNKIFDWNKDTNFPILMPIFPRIRRDSGTIYTHMLSSEALRTKEFDLERIDIQLINMIKDAKERLLLNEIIVDDKIIIDGFSASSKFANRFTILHPELVKLSIGGAVSGFLTLPLKTFNGEKLIYPIGVGDLEEITEEKIEMFLKVKQFYYQGMKDDNDPFISTSIDNYIPKYEGITNEQELKQLYTVLGRNMTQDRWLNTQRIYNSLNANVEFGSYLEAGHNPNCANDKVKELLNQELKRNNKERV